MRIAHGEICLSYDEFKRADFKEILKILKVGK